MRTPDTGFTRIPSNPRLPAESALDRRVALAQLLFVWVLLVAKALLLRVLVLDDASLVSALVYEGVFIGALLVLVDFVFPDHRFAALVLTDLILSAAMLATSVYAAYYGEVPTPALLGLAGQVPAVKESIAGLLSWVQLLFFIDIPLQIAAAFAFVQWRRRNGYELPSERVYVRQPLPVLALGVGALALALVFGASVTKMPDPIDGKAASTSEGVFTYQMASVVPRPKYVSKVDLGDNRAVQAEIDRLRGGSTGKRFVDFPVGAARGKNVILIQVEALQNVVLGLKVNGQEVTPNLNRLAAKSWYFPNAYTQIAGGSTSDAEFAANTSLYPPVSGAASVKLADREIPSLPRMMNGAGYETLTFHANTVHFWNRKQLYEALGFTKYFDASFFSNTDVLSMGPSDEALFRESLPELVKRDKEGKKFLAEFITLSSHRPFDAIPPARQGIALPPEAQGTLPGNYVIAQNYADKAIGQFLDDLERSGLADKTMVIVYGDHWGLADAGYPEVQKALFGRENNEIDLLNIPMIVHMPGQVAGTVVPDAAGQVDIAPTVADALGLDDTRSPHFGRSLFVRSRVLLGAGRLVALGSYVDERLMFVPGATFADGHAYDTTTKQPLAAQAASDDKWQRMRETIQLSDSYTQLLPKRRDYQPDKESVVPQAP